MIEYKNPIYYLISFKTKHRIAKLSCSANRQMVILNDILDENHQCSISFGFVQVLLYIRDIY